MIARINFSRPFEHQEGKQSIFSLFITGPVFIESTSNYPRHTVKFGFRELNSEPLNSSSDENNDQTRKRRVYMHYMVINLSKRLITSSFVF
jgi:hypothetical protein